ncbi:hypothetical protein HGM15179_003204 [Zosterops borbonicus]|uniref:Uncharacterized protein n=1 Tax=Zosterops borbonicus TaxID=364589 RepID=A0A8K1GTM6_9PASS|nr:hypothetical protein HGM15179_003204 [Zosterops borbonicus]
MTFNQSSSENQSNLILNVNPVLKEQWFILKKFLRDDDANLINSLASSSTLRRNKQNEISIRLTHEIDIRKSFSWNETMRPDEIREGHRKEIRTIQPILDTWTA